MSEVLVVIAVSVVTASPLDPDDVLNEVDGHYVVSVPGLRTAEDAVEWALDYFHDHVAIAVLDDFQIEARVADEVPASAWWL